MTEHSYHFTDEIWHAAINPDMNAVRQLLCEAAGDYFVLGELTGYRA